MKKTSPAPVFSFERVVNNHLTEVANGLSCRCNSVSREEIEDIVMMALEDVWKKLEEGSLAHEEKAVVSMWKTISFYKFTHLNRHLCFSVEWDNDRLQNGWEEHDFGWEQTDERSIMKREMLDRMRETFSAKDNLFIDMVLQSRPLTEIAQVLGYTPVSARNRKCKILARLRALAQQPAYSVGYAISA